MSPTALSSLADGSDGSAGVFQGRISKASVFEDTRFGSVPCASILTGATVQLLEQDDRRPIRYYLVLVREKDGRNGMA